MTTASEMMIQVKNRLVGASAWTVMIRSKVWQNREVEALAASFVGSRRSSWDLTDTEWCLARIQSVKTKPTNVMPLQLTVFLNKTRTHNPNAIRAWILVKTPSRTLLMTPFSPLDMNCSMARHLKTACLKIRNESCLGPSMITLPFETRICVFELHLSCWMGIPMCLMPVLLPDLTFQVLTVSPGQFAQVEKRLEICYHRLTMTSAVNDQASASDKQTKLLQALPALHHKA